MQRNACRKPGIRGLIALTLFAWLAGSVWHGAMQVGGALGQEICTAQGATYLPGDAPAQPGRSGAKSCTLCAAFAAPANASAPVALALPFAPISTPCTLLCGARSGPLRTSPISPHAPPRA